MASREDRLRAEQEGRDAYYDGMSKSENPYPGGHRLRAVWDFGYRHAKRQEQWNIKKKMEQRK